MAVKAIAHAYWRSIKRGTRPFDSISESIKNDVRSLAQTDVQSGEITAEEYERYIGEEYPAE